MPDGNVNPQKKEGKPEMENEKVNVDNSINICVLLSPLTFFKRREDT